LKNEFGLWNKLILHLQSVFFVFKLTPLSTSYMPKACAEVVEHVFGAAAVCGAGPPAPFGLRLRDAGDRSGLAGTDDCIIFAGIGAPVSAAAADTARTERDGGLPCRFRGGCGGTRSVSLWSADGASH